VPGADRLAQLARLEHAGRERAGGGAQAVDARHLLGEGVGRELGELLQLDLRRVRQQQRATALPARSARSSGPDGRPGQARSTSAATVAAISSHSRSPAASGSARSPASAGVAASSSPSWAAKATSTGDS